MEEPRFQIKDLLRQLRPVMYAVVAMSFFLNLLILPLSLYSLQVLDRVMSTGSIPTLLWLTLMMVVSFSLVGALFTLRGMVLTRASDWFHEQVTAQILPLVLSQSAVGGPGAQPMRDATTLRQCISGNGFATLLDAPWAMLYIAVLFIVHSMLGLLVTAGAALLLLLAWMNELGLRDLLKESGQRALRNVQALECSTRNAEVTQAMGMTEALARRWQTMQADVMTQQLRAADRAALLQGITKFVRLTLQVLVTCVAAWFALKGELSVGAIIAATILASRALSPFETTIASWKLLVESWAAYGRLQQLLTDSVGRGESLSLPAPAGALTVEQLTYLAPHRESPVLQDVTFALAPGEALGIIGPSGSGKSTLARLIMGVHLPASGVVRLDSADISRWPRQEFGQHVGYVPQDVELFGGNVRDNISRFSAEASSSAIIRAAQIAGAHELILHLPQGYETNIGFGGAHLSAGQRQRIALARAFYGEPRLLVLDEPDANLDQAGQQGLRVALQLAKQRGITTILITHRKSLLSHAHKLLLLRDGKVESFGPAEQVMSALQTRGQTLPIERAIA